MTVQDGGCLEEMLRTKPDHVLLNIMQMPHLWIEWEQGTLCRLMNPDAVKTMQLLLHKKIQLLSNFYDEQISEVALSIRQKQQQREEEAERGFNG